MLTDTQQAGVEPRESLVRAAEYVRMSTEHQQYSTENQRSKIREYAQRRGLSIVRTYADEGKSGLLSLPYFFCSPTLSCSGRHIGLLHFASLILSDRYHLRSVVHWYRNYR